MARTNLPLASTGMLVACIALISGALRANVPPSSAIAIRNTWSASSQGTPVSIEDLVALRDIGGPRGGLIASSDGRSIAFQVRQMRAATNDYALTWYALTTSDGTVEPMAGGGELVTSIDDDGTNNGNPATPVGAWSASGRQFAFLRKEAGQIQVWCAEPGRKPEGQLTRADGDVKAFKWISESRILFTQTESRTRQAENLEQARRDGFRWDDQFWPRYAWLPRPDRKSDGRVWAVDVPSKAVAEATDDEKAWFVADETLLKHRPAARLVALARSGRRAASAAALGATPKADAPNLTLVVSDRNDAEHALVCQSPSCSGRIAQVWWNDQEDGVFFIRREGHAFRRTAVYEWRPGDRETRQVLATDDWLSGDCVGLKDRAICLYETVIQPRVIASVDMKDGRITPWVDPNPKMQARGFSAIEKLEWKDEYGNETIGHLVFPRGFQPGHPYPLILVQYQSSGQFLRGGIGEEYPIHAAAAAGYFVLSWDRPEFRQQAAYLSPEDFTRFIYSENREQRSTLSALTTIIEYLAARGLVDPTRVGVTGLSNGASTAYNALIHSNLFSVAVLSQGASDPIHYHILSRNYRKTVQGLSGMPSPDSGQAAEAWWRNGSLALNVQTIRAPLMLHLSDAELGGAMQTVSALQDADKPFEAYVYPGEFHIKHQPRHLLKSMERTLDWFNFWLLGQADEAVEKREQYERWTRMKRNAASP